MEMLRETVIEKLIEEKIGTIKQMLENDKYSYIDSILRYGEKGFENLTDEELIKEYENAFGDTITISENGYMCNKCGGLFPKEEMDFDVNDQDLCKNCNTFMENEAPYGNY